MHEEIEIRVVLKDPVVARAALNESARFIKERVQKDEYFVPRDDDFFAAEKPDKWFRVRAEQGADSLNFSLCRFDGNGKLMQTEEYESGIANPGAVSEILQKVGFIKKAEVIKSRAYFQYQDYEITIDEVDNLGTLMEVELKRPAALLILEEKQKCYAALAELGIAWEEAPNMGYPMMILKNIHVANYRPNQRAA